MTTDRFAQIERLYHAARERAPEARPAFLAEACGGDGELRREVESLLAAESAPPGFLEPAAIQGARAMTKGTLIGAYRIDAQIGAGGMGEVYRAHDVKLRRDVALKVLPQALAGDRDRLARLEREARLLAALNHPNIAHVYGLEETDGTRALVMELIDGDTLADRIARGPIPVGEALSLARQMAAALAAAHEQGIIHRDLKPANIKLRDRSTVKVLDFGLAKALDSAVDPAGSPTITAPAVMTTPGVVLGSAAYMAPEQAMGLQADKRCDIWAFGCVVYEMLTGQRAFAGSSVSETLAAVLRGEPDWNALPADLPAPVRTLLTRCLEKDRSERVQDISTARFVLAELAGAGSDARAAAAAGPRGRRRVTGWVALAAVVGGAAGAASMWLRPQQAAAVPRTARFALATSTTPPASGTLGTLVALSPDGSSIVHVTLRDGIPQLVLQRLNSLESTLIAGTEGGTDPFFSPDGLQVGFMVAGELKRIPVEGGRATTIWHGDPTFEGAVWLGDGTIVFAQGFGLHRIAENGGAPQVIAQPDAFRDEAGFDRPSLLPGGSFLYTVEVRGGRSRIAARRLTGGEPKTILEDGFGAQYLPGGYLVFARANRLMAVRFNAATLETSGNPVALEQAAFTNASEAVSNVAIAADGTAVFLSGSNPGALGRVAWVDRSGAHIEPLVDQPLEDPRNVRLSPDGRRVALAVGPAGQADIWVYDVTHAARPVRLTFRDHNTFPVWSPDGRQIAFLTHAESTGRPFFIRSDGGVIEPEALTAVGTHGAPMDWSPSALLLYWNSTLWQVRPPDKTLTPWAPAPFTQFGARFSPDGRWVAYVSTQTGTAEVWVRPFPGPGVPVRVSSGGGHEPTWSHDGKEIFFTNGTKMMAARVTTLDPSPVIEAPRQLFEGGFATDSLDLVLRFYDVAPNGRFLMIEPAQVRNPSIVVAQHWDQELNARLPK